MQHFSQEEKAFAEKMIDLCQQVEHTYSYRLTTFLNPRQDEIVTSIATHFQLSVFSSRSIWDLEYSRVIIAPAYYQLEKQDFEISIVEIVYPRKYHQLSHSQVLGALLHQLGIRRELMGDIVVDEEVLVMLDRRFVPLLETEVTKIARVPVRWQVRDDANLTPIRQIGQIKEMIVSSLRLDKLIAVAFQQSRTNATKLITSRQVKLDYTTVEQVGRLVEIGQLLSVRGFGRVRLKSLLGTTKQGKLKIEIELIKK